MIQLLARWLKSFITQALTVWLGTIVYFLNWFNYFFFLQCFFWFLFLRCWWFWFRFCYLLRFWFLTLWFNFDINNVLRISNVWWSCCRNLDNWLLFSLLFLLLRFLSLNRCGLASSIFLFIWGFVGLKVIIKVLVVILIIIIWVFVLLRYISFFGEYNCAIFTCCTSWPLNFFLLMFYRIMLR